MSYKCWQLNRRFLTKSNWRVSPNTNWIKTSYHERDSWICVAYISTSGVILWPWWATNINWIEKQTATEFYMCRWFCYLINTLKGHIAACVTCDTIFAATNKHTLCKTYLLKYKVIYSCNTFEIIKAEVYSIQYYMEASVLVTGSQSSVLYAWVADSSKINPKLFLTVNTNIFLNMASYC